MGRHARLEEVRVIVERRDVDRQVAVLPDDLPDPFADVRSLIQTHLIPLWRSPDGLRAYDTIVRNPAVVLPLRTTPIGRAGDGLRRRLFGT